VAQCETPASPARQILPQTLQRMPGHIRRPARDISIPFCFSEGFSATPAGLPLAKQRSPSAAEVSLVPQVASSHPSAKTVHAPAAGARAAAKADRDARSPFASLLDDVNQPKGPSTPAAQSSASAEPDAGTSSDRASDGQPNRTGPTAPSQAGSRPTTSPKETDAAAAETPGLSQNAEQAADNAALVPPTGDPTATAKDATGAGGDSDKTDDSKKSAADPTNAGAEKPASPTIIIVTLPAAAAACPVAVPAQTSSSGDAAPGQKEHGATLVLAAASAGEQPAGKATASADPAGEAADGTPQPATEAGSAKAPSPTPQTGKSDASASRPAAPAGDTPTGANASDESSGIQPPTAAESGSPAASPATAEKPATQHAGREQASPPHHPATQDSTGGPGAPGGGASADASTSGALGGGTATSAFTGPASSHGVSTAAPAPAAHADPGASGAQPAPVPIAGIAVAIAGRALSGNHHFDIRLDPPELGRIEVRLKVDRDGRVTSHLIADRRDTFDLLRKDMPGLERALQDAGLKTAGDGLQFSLRDQSAGGGQDGSRPRTPNLIVPDDVAPALDVSARGYGRFAGRVGGLDIRV
jgi:flagellar hook-length control protein FliK